MFERVDTNILCPAFGQFISHIAIINRYVAAKIVFKVNLLEKKTNFTITTNIAIKYLLFPKRIKS